MLQKQDSLQQEDGSLTANTKLLQHADQKTPSCIDMQDGKSKSLILKNI